MNSSEARQQQGPQITITTTYDSSLRQTSKWPISWKNPQTQKARAKQKAKESKAKMMLTDEQRTAWAHAHFIINHGTASDAARFLTHKFNTINTPIEALHKVKMLARMKVPTWEEAAEAVFSSSSEDSAELTVTAVATTPANANPDQEPRPQSPTNTSQQLQLPTTPSSSATVTARTPNPKSTTTTTSQPVYMQSRQPTTISQLSPKKQIVGTKTMTVSPSSPTISGHHYPSYARQHDTSPTHPNIDLSPIHPSMCILANTTFECVHTPNTNQDDFRQPFISMMNDTYLIIHNN